MRSVFLFALALVAPVFSLQPGIFVGLGRVEDLRLGPSGGESQAYTTVGLSLSHRVFFVEPFARAEFGRIHPGDADGSEESPLLNAGFGVRARAPLPGGFGLGAGAGAEYVLHVRDEPTGGDVIGVGFQAGFQPFGGLRLDWRDRLFAELEMPLAGSHLEWALRLGVQPLAWFR